MKKFIPILIIVLIITMLFPMSSFAHRHSDNGNARTARAICTIENCNINYSHRHGNKWYSGHSIGDGHDYHEICSISDCTQTITHNHSGVICLPHNQSDDYGYHAYSHRSRGMCH